MSEVRVALALTQIGAILTLTSLALYLVSAEVAIAHAVFVAALSSLATAFALIMATLARGVTLGAAAIVEYVAHMAKRERCAKDRA